MRREQTLEEISDGKLYDSNDMVKADCHDCEGCCDCCQGMGDSVLLDPYDVYRLSAGLQKSAEQLLQEYLELGVTDGNILPHLRMTGVKEQCIFLNSEGRVTSTLFGRDSADYSRWEDSTRMAVLNIFFRFTNVLKQTAVRSR